MSANEITLCHRTVEIGIAAGCPDCANEASGYVAPPRTLDMTRVLSTAGETIATYGHEWYPGHVATIVYELNPHLRVQSTEDGGATWTDVTDRTVPYA